MKISIAGGTGAMVRSADREVDCQRTHGRCSDPFSRELFRLSMQQGIEPACEWCLMPTQ